MDQRQDLQQLFCGKLKGAAISQKDGLGVAACLTAAALFGPLPVPEVPGLLG